MNQIHPIPEEHLPHCAGCSGQWDNHDTGCFCRYGQEPGKCEGPKTVDLCPVCIEKGERVAMVRGRATGYYWLCKCPRCGNLRLVEREKESHGNI